MTGLALILGAYLLAIAAVVFLLRADSDRTIVLSSYVITLCFGLILWEETHEYLVFFILLVLLLLDMSLIRFAPMLRIKSGSGMQPTKSSQLYLAQTIWILLVVFCLALKEIWGVNWSSKLHPVAKVFSQTIFTEFWTTHWPMVMVLGLLALGSAVAALIMVRFTKEEAE